MKIKLYGVMGSISGGASDLGRNTTCLVLSNKESDLILDSGTGILNYINSVAKNEHYILLSHYHMDHILGFPFITQLYSSTTNKIKLYGPNFNNKNVEEELFGFMCKPYLPIERDHVLAEISSTSLEEGKTYFINGFEVEALRVKHPGGSLIYTIKAEGKKVAFLSDFPNDMDLDDAVIKFCSKSNLIYADAMFLESEFTNKKLLEYGHSSIESVIRFFEKTDSKKLILGHHKITRNYGELIHYETDSITIAKENIEILI